MIWASEGWNVLGDAFRDGSNDCIDAYISIPPVTADKTMLRDGEALRMRERGTRIHAMAEIHWASWNTWREATGATWREVGHEARRRMEAAGYCVEAGDTWAINEAPSTIRSDPDAIRPGFIELVHGLFEGDTGMPESQGAVFVVGLGHRTTNFSVYEPRLQDWLADSDFWVEMNRYVRFWSQEVYTDPSLFCAARSSLPTRSTRIADYVMHVPRLAAAAPDSAGTNTAQSYLSRTYVPLMNAVWDSTVERGYGDTTVPLDTMIHLISEQVYAARTWADDHTYPDGRIGFAFGSYHDPTEWATLAAQMVRAIASAYGPSGIAQDACVEDGDDRWCACNVAGATLNDDWDETFSTW